MRKNYKCSNIKFCMEDENQRRTWEYLHRIVNNAIALTRKDGSYGKILSDAFVTVLDGQMQDVSGNAVNDLSFPPVRDTDVLEKMLDRALEQKFQELQEVMIEQIDRSFSGCMLANHSDEENFIEKADADGIGQMQEEELSEDMMAFAFSMGE